MIDELDGIGLANAIRNGTLSAREAVETALARAEAATLLGAIRWMDAERALVRADGLDKLNRQAPELAQAMPFFGVPFLVKDLGSAAAGFPVLCGSRLLLGSTPAPSSSQLPQRFEAAGLVPFGVTTVPESGSASRPSQSWDRSPATRST